MKKMLIVPAIVAFASLSGSAFAQTTVVGIIGVGNPTTATGSAVTNTAPVFTQTGTATAANTAAVGLVAIQDAAAANFNSATAGIGNQANGALILQ